jgi:hypothetical protein
MVNDGGLTPEDIASDDV